MMQRSPLAPALARAVPLRRAANLGCIKNSGLYAHPRNESVVIHYVKKPLGMQYLWGVLHEGRQHEPRTCKRTAGVA